MAGTDSAVDTALPARCPRCGGPFGAPVSGDVHCYVECSACGTRFELDDPDLASRTGRPR